MAIRIRNLQNIISHSRFVAEPPYAPLHIGYRFEGRDFDRERSEQGAGLFGEIRPIQRGRNGFHMNDTLDAMTILSGPVKPEYSASVVQYEQYAVAEIERIPEREE
jgi:hypothetical protein